MKKISRHLNTYSNKYCFGVFIISVFASIYSPLFSQNNSIKDKNALTRNSDEKLINQYIDAKGEDVITFDPSNIKQFWIEHSIVGKTDRFEINLKRNGTAFESTLHKIQLANVYAFQDCKVEVISETPDFGFSVLNSKSKVLSTSSKEPDFLNYSIASSVFHLEDTKALSFSLRFTSQKSTALSIKRIIISFSNNSNYLSSPGVLKVSPDNISLEGLAFGEKSIEKITPVSDSSFVVTGKWFEFNSKKRIILSSRPVKYTLKIKNIGDEPTAVYVGYAPYTENGERINMRNNLYKSHKIMKVLNSEVNSNKIIVDSYPEWTNGCSLALNAKEDLSDFPNFSLEEGNIIDVKKISDDQTEITFDKPLKKAIEKETLVRIQAPNGYTYLYMNIKTLQPGEEVTWSSTVAKDNSFLEYSTKAFCRGTCYVVPLVLSHSVNSKNTNTIQISDYEISY